ncbi:swollenin/expansin family protein [Pelomyxa schiedti]|nr:swollenin/expansin family protein [Pelomyxa schiedti]
MSPLLWSMVVIMGGAFVGAVREPSRPMEPCTEGMITHYDVDLTQTSGKCQFGPTNGPSGPGYNFTAAPSNVIYFMPQYGDDVIACGICYELVGPISAVRLMVTDSCPDCSEPYAHFDLSPQAFDVLMDPRTGMGSENVTYRMISCDVDGPIKLLIKEDSSEYYTAFTVVNHRVGVLSLEVSQHGGTDAWETIPRQEWNEFEVHPNGDGFNTTTPLHVRVTSLTGQQITVIVNEVIGGAVVDGPSQFDQVPYGFGGSSPECCEPPNNFGILFDDDFEGPWEKWGSLGSIDTSTKHSGTSSLDLNFDAWDGINIGTNIPATRNQFDTLQFWARVTGSFESLMVTLHDNLDSIISDTALFTTLTSSWQLFELNLTVINCPDFINTVYFQNSGNTVELWLDDIELILSPTRPSLAECSDPVVEGLHSASGWVPPSPSDSTSHTPSTSMAVSSLPHVQLALLCFMTFIIAF